MSHSINGLRRVWIKHEGRCHYCDRLTLQPAQYVDRKSDLRPTRDHRIPRSRGGYGEDNLVLACIACNQMKGSLTETEFVDAVLWMVERNLPPIPAPIGSNFCQLMIALRRYGYPKLMDIEAAMIGRAAA